MTGLDPKNRNWNDLYLAWAETLRKKSFGWGREYEARLFAARKRIALNSPADWDWLREALDDSERKWFVADVFQKAPLPRRLLSAMIEAGVKETNPRRNRMFIAACVRSFGNQQVIEWLCRYLKEGSNAEKAGAARAFYWAADYQARPGTSDLRDAFYSQLLSEFVNNTDIEVRRHTLPLLRLRVGEYPPQDAGLVKRAVAIARSHDDEYIRHRVEKQLGADGPYLPVPEGNEIQPQRATASWVAWFRRCSRGMICGAVTGIAATLIRDMDTTWQVTISRALSDWQIAAMSASFGFVLYILFDLRASE